MTSLVDNPLPGGWGKAQLSDRLRAMLVHLVLSALVAALAAAVVFALWYPMPYREISGGRDLFLILVAVDVVMGPILTFVVFDRRKLRVALTRDLGVIVLLQLGALAYGLYAVERARPAVVALEVDRLRVVRSSDLSQANFSNAPAGIQTISFWGPTLIATRLPAENERQEVLSRGLAGEDIGMRPKFWLPASATGPAMAQAAQPLAKLRRLYPNRAGELDAAIAETQRPAESLKFLPILARRTDWVALVDAGSGSIVGYAPFDGF